jgi:hypothetical protein
MGLITEMCLILCNKYVVESRTPKVLSGLYILLSGYLQISLAWIVFSCYLLLLGLRNIVFRCQK